MMPLGLELAPSAQALGFWTAALFCVVVLVALNFGSRDWRAVRTVNHFVCIVALWNMARALQMSAVDAETAELFIKCRLLIEPMMLAAGFEFFHVMIEGRLRRWGWLLAAQVGAATTSLLVLFTPWVVAGVQQAPWGFEVDYGMLAPGYLLGLLVLIGVVVADLFAAFKRSPRGTAEHRRLQWIVFLLVSTLFVLADLWLPYAVLMQWPATPLGHTVSIVVVAGVIWLAWRHRIIALNRRIVAEPLMQHIDQGVMLIDEDEIIRSANPRALSLLGETSTRLLGGRRLGDYIGVKQPLAELAQAQSEAATPSPELVVAVDERVPNKALLMNVIALKTEKDTAYTCLLKPAVSADSSLRAASKTTKFFDALTGMPGRAMFLSQMHVRLDRAEDAERHPLTAVWVLAIQRMRVVNEDLGFAVGDRVLVEVARRLRKAVGERGLLARIGGDEFAVAMRLAGEADADVVSTQIQTALDKSFDVGDHALHVRVALGIAMGESEASASLLALASANASAKSQVVGGAGVSTNIQGKGRTRMEDRLRRALAAGELRPYYQPIVDTRTGSIAGFEALVRWIQPGSIKPVLPGQFIPLAEEIGLIGEMDARMVEQGALDLKAIQQATGRSDLFISVNLDNSKLLERDLVPWLSGLVKQHDLPPGTLKLEILESAALHESLSDKLEALVRAGVGLSIDDFGTGESSLSRLLDVPAQILKIDRTFVNAMNEASGGNLLAGIVALADSLKLQTLAEGVELAEQVKPLAAMGCSLIQGFLFSPAMPVDQALAALNDPDWVDQRLRPSGKV